ncbi:hypothetical protein SH2C18_04390 [Clostridium sediminicola]
MYFESMLYLNISGKQIKLCETDAFIKNIYSLSFGFKIISPSFTSSALYLNLIFFSSSKHKSKSTLIYGNSNVFFSS